MTEITMLEFQSNAEAIIRKVQQGTSMLLTEQGEPVIRLEPIVPSKNNGEKSLLSLLDLSEQWVESGESTPLTNDDIDRIVYGL